MPPQRVEEGVARAADGVGNNTPGENARNAARRHALRARVLRATGDTQRALLRARVS
jgi:hypothetical protein